MSYLTITSAGIVICTLSEPQEGMDYFHLQQQLEAKSKLLLVSTWVVLGAGFVRDVPSKR